MTGNELDERLKRIEELLARNLNHPSHILQCLERIEKAMSAESDALKAAAQAVNDGVDRLVAASADAETNKQAITDVTTQLQAVVAKLPAAA